MTVIQKLFVVAAFLLGCSLYAENDVVRVRKAVGRWEVSGDITVAQAEERAFMEAKKEALRKAGTDDGAWALLGPVCPADGEKFYQEYTLVCNKAVDRLVDVLAKHVEDVRDSDTGCVFREVTINADVAVGEVMGDPDFKITVSGIDSDYVDEDIFTCSFTVHGSDSYIKIFWFTNDEAAMIYPNDYEGDQVFAAGGTYNVPVTDSIELVMAKSDPDVETEFINIIVLATKKNYPYLGEMDFQSILSWIYNLPADQRVIYHDSTVIK